MEHILSSIIFVNLLPISNSFPHGYPTVPPGIELLESALQRNDVAGQLEARHGMDAAISRLGWHSLLTTGLLPEDDVAWEKRAEALWRLRQWGPIEGSSDVCFQYLKKVSLFDFIDFPRSRNIPESKKRTDI